MLQARRYYSDWRAYYWNWNHLQVFLSSAWARVCTLQSAYSKHSRVEIPSRQSILDPTSDPLQTFIIIEQARTVSRWHQYICHARFEDHVPCSNTVNRREVKVENEGCMRLWRCGGYRYVSGGREWARFPSWLSRFGTSAKATEIGDIVIGLA